MTEPRLSVVMPVHNASAYLDRTLSALRASVLPRSDWELIVVDDASTDASVQIAAPFADRMVGIAGTPRGPAAARNRGAAVCRGRWLVFVDADVAVHGDALTHFAAYAGDGSADAVFGAYDDSPAAPGFLSQYRNLLHHRTHVHGAGTAETFWAGCGGVSRVAFEAVGGFDEARYPRPQIEDIDLGYRLSDRGYRIVLDPSIQGTHLKAWAWGPSMRTDVLDRGAPWVRLLRERSALGRSGTLNVRPGERLRLAGIWAGFALLAAAAFARSVWLAAGGTVCIAAVLCSNAALIGWFQRKRGTGFAVAAAGMNVLYYVASGLAVIAGVLTSRERSARQSGTSRS